MIKVIKCTALFCNREMRLILLFVWFVKCLAFLSGQHFLRKTKNNLRIFQVHFWNTIFSHTENMIAEQILFFYLQQIKDFYTLNDHFSQAISQKWNLRRFHKNCFHELRCKTLLEVKPAKQSQRKMWRQQNTST